MSSWDRRAEIVRKIRALKGVAESTSFMGQREAAEAAIERLARKYEVDVEEMRDEEKKGRVIATPAGWRRKVALYLAFYLDLAPGRTWIVRKGQFIVNATDAEFSLYTEALQMHLRNITEYEFMTGFKVKRLQKAVRDERVKARLAIRQAKKAVAEAKREKAAKMKWYWQGYVTAVMPTNGKGKKCKVTPAEADAHDAGTEAGRRVQIEKGNPALT